MPQLRQCVISLSGGLDSTSLLLHLLARGARIQGISFDYGQKHRLELQRLQANLEYLRTRGHEIDWHLVDLSTVQPLLHSALTNADWTVPEGHYENENMRATVVPNRNAIFASIAYASALSIATRTRVPCALALGVHQGDHEVYPDCRPEFYEAIARAFGIGNWDSQLVEWYLPYLKLDKTAILGDALGSCKTLGLDFDTVFRNTCTSYAPDDEGRSHGLTGSDVERILAFHSLGRKDPLEYQQPWDDVVNEAVRLERQHRLNEQSATQQNA